MNENDTVISLNDIKIESVFECGKVIIGDKSEYEDEKEKEMKKKLRCLKVELKEEVRGLYIILKIVFVRLLL